MCFRGISPSSFRYLFQIAKIRFKRESDNDLFDKAIQSTPNKVSFNKFDVNVFSMKHSLFLLIVIFSGKLFSQDSLVRINEVNFSSDFERETFVKFNKSGNKELLLPLLLTTYDLANTETAKQINDKISSLTDQLLSEGIRDKKNDKKIKIVYHDVHTAFLKKYQEEVHFQDIFTSGNYNCVTASALFAFVFEKLDIPYEIKEEPTHVYLLAYPNSSNILVETTTPLTGFLAFDDRFKQNFINVLKNQKIIGSSELSSKSTDELFNAYYFKKEKLALQQLVGVHFYNDALFKRDKNDIKGAYQQMEKAYILYKAPKSEYLLMHFGVELISKEKLQPKDKALLISKISRYKDQGITSEMIKGEFINLTNDLLTRDNNKNLYKECYQVINRGITDIELSKEISYIYFYENGRILYNQGNFTSAKPYFEKALAIQPNNSDLIGIFTTSIANTLRNERRAKPISDSLEVYIKKFPALLLNNNFNSMIAMSYALRFGEAYQKSNRVEGETYKSKFEEIISSNKDLSITPSLVGSAYASAGSFYFKLGQKKIAKELIEKGLEIVPENFELRARLQMINGH